VEGLAIMKRSAHVVVSVAFGLAPAFVAPGTLFAAGENLTVPGGWRGVGLVALGGRTSCVPRRSSGSRCSP
jgi:hypothetical protein